LKEVGVTLDGDGELLSLSPARVRCDLADALRSDWIIEADEATIAAACDALPGLTRRFSERYGEWIDEIRARLETQFRRAALRVLSDAKAEGRWYDVEHWALMLLRTDPLNETAVLARAGCRGVIFGHAGDAHAHVNVLADLTDPDWRARCEQVLTEVTALVAQLGGTVAGEHGDGRLRTPLLPQLWPA